MATVTSLGFSLFARNLMSKGLGSATKDVESFQAKVTSAGKTMATVGAGMTATVTAPIGAAGAAILQLGGDFEASMQRVKAVSGATEEEFASLRDLAKDLGSTTAFSASEAADGMQYLAMAGFDAADTMTALPGVLDLAAAGAVDLGTAADVASNILSGFGMETAEITRLNDVLAKTFTSTNTDLEMLGESFKYVGPVASSAGLSIEETAAAIGLLGNAGIQGSEAGTALRGSIARLLSPTAEVTETLNSLGVSVTDSQGKLLPLVDIVRQLESAGADTADMMTIFGLEAGPAMQALVSQGSDALAGLTGDLKTAGGTAADIASTQMEGFNGSLKELQSAAEGLAIAVAESGLLEWAADLTKNVTTWVQEFSQANPVLFRVGVILGVVAAAIGPLLVMLGMMVASIGALSAISLPVVGIVALVVAGIVALGAAIYLAWTRSETFRDTVMAAWDGIKAGWQALWDGVLKPGLDALVAWWESTWPTIKDTALEAWDTIQAYFEQIRPKLEEIFGQVQEIVGGALEWIQGFWEDHGDKIMGFLDFLMTTVGGIFKGAFAIIGGIVKGAWQIISGIFSGALDVISGILDIFIGLFTGDWERMWEGVKSVFSGLWTAVEAIFTGAVTILGGILDGLVEAIKAPFLWIWNWLVGNSLIPDLVNGIVSWFTSLRDKAANLFTQVKDWIVQRVMALYTMVRVQILLLHNRVVTIFYNLRAGARLIWDTVRDWIVDRAQQLRERVVNAVTTLKDKVINAFEKAKDGVKSVWDKLKSVAKAPVKFVIQTVYNKGIVPLWNKVADKVPGLSELKEMRLPEGFARGGILAGRSSWRSGDDQIIRARRGEGIYVSEAMRDPYERARLHAVNQAALRGQDLSRFRDVPLDSSPSNVARGQPPYDLPGFARGGIVGEWLSSSWDSIVGKVQDWATKPLRALRDTLKEEYGSGQNFRAIPYHVYELMRKKILDRLAGVDADHAAQAGGGAADWTGLGNASQRLQRAARWARLQHGKPYIWGGAGPAGYDCSGFMGAIENKIRGVGPYFRRYSTHAFRGSSAPEGWVKGLASPFTVGITHAGVGHTAGTLMGVNVESRGSAGVVVGTGARGARSPLFGSWYGFRPVAGDAVAAGGAGRRRGAPVFDRGGTLAPGLNLVDNRTGGPEPLVRADQEPRREYHITVHVDPTSNPAEVGKRLVEAIQAYERRNGARWRR